MAGKDIAVTLANWIAAPVMQVGLPIFCVAWLHAGFAEGTLTLILSILALTFSQLVLFTGRRFEAAVAAKLDELLFAFPEARDELLHLEERDPKEIEQVRR